METKQCTKCGEVKPVSEFHKKLTSYDHRCKPCVKEYQKAHAANTKEQRKTYLKKYREANAERIKEVSKERYKANIDKYKEYYKANANKVREYSKANADSKVLSRIKGRATRKGLEFNLELEDVLGVTHCPVFGWELKRHQDGKKGAVFNSPSVDRIIPELGYTKDNIQILSYKANTMKSDATPEELLMFADWIYKTYQK